MPVADPGFRVGGALTRWGGANLRRIHFLMKTYVKMKEIDPVGGGGMRRQRPLDPPMNAICGKNCFDMEHWSLLCNQVVGTQLSVFQIIPII